MIIIYYYTILISVLKSYVNSTGSMNAGEILSLTCFATRVHNISGDVSIRWVGPDGIAISSGGFVQLEPPQLSGNVRSLTIQFSPLYTSHGGVYTCESTFDSDSIMYTISTLEEVVVNGKCRLLTNDLVYLFSSWYTSL